MKRNHLIALLLCCVALLAACGKAPADNNQQAGNDGKTPTEQVKTMNAEEAKQKIDSGNVVVVDVRTAEEFAEKHIPGALLIPNESIASQPPAELPDKDAEILVYCRSGRRSQEAAKKLVRMGYTNVANMGGIIDWPYETATGEK